ncbi:MAG: hypothetical protein GTO14_01950 [Anaerolineales bacterium]|nr:hypothetical protein [Anaerolineales bacterium]
MLLIDAPADTFNFMVLGFAVILGTMALFIISLVVRFRNFQRDLDLLGEIEAEEGDVVGSSN